MGVFQNARVFLGSGGSGAEADEQKDVLTGM